MYPLDNSKCSMCCSFLSSCPLSFFHSSYCPTVFWRRKKISCHFLCSKSIRNLSPIFTADRLLVSLGKIGCTAALYHFSFQRWKIRAKYSNHYQNCLLSNGVLVTVCTVFPLLSCLFMFFDFLLSQLPASSHNKFKISTN